MRARTATNTTNTPLGTALSSGSFFARVVDIDHYAIHNGLVVETDYVIEVKAHDENFR